MAEKKAKIRVTKPRIEEHDELSRAHLDQEARALLKKHGKKNNKGGKA